jgi:predicted O-methyltransferase YrrM
MKKSLLPDQVDEFVNELLTRETPIQKQLRTETAQLPMAVMQVSPDQGAFLALLVRLIGARRSIEVGTFTGYSALAVAAALPADGRLIACDVNAEWTAIARRYWAQAGVADRIELRLAPAAETLGALLRGGAAGTYDFAFIDADKPNYDSYYESCLALLRPGGLMALDNMLWSGAVADPTAHDPETDALRNLDLKIRDDARVDASIVTIGDGLMLARKR